MTPLSDTSIVLDVAAGMLLAHGIRATAVRLFTTANEDSRGGEDNPVALWGGFVIVALAAALIVWRLFRSG